MRERPALRLGLVGLGTWARVGHLSVYGNARLRGVVDVAALCSRSLERAESWAREFGIRATYSSFGKMLEKESLDVVSVCTPDFLHAEFVLKALDAGCHVLVEKPLGMNLDECRRILEKQKQTGRRVITMYHKRADPLWAEAGARIREGHYGALQMGWALIENPLSVPAGSYFSSDMASHTDPNWFLGTHFYDLIRLMTGLNPTEVRAFRYDGALRARGVPAPDGMKVDVGFENGASVSFFLAWNLPEGSPGLTKQAMTLHFERGELELDGLRRGFQAFGEPGYAYVNPYFLRDTPAGKSGYGAHFLEEALLSLWDPNHVSSVALPTLEDAWWASATAEAAQRSIQESGLASVTPPPK